MLAHMIKPTFSHLAAFSLLMVSAIAAADDAPAPWLPKDPGKAQCRVTRDGGELANSALRFAVAAQDGELTPAAFDNRYTASPHALSGNLFALNWRDKTKAPLILHLDGKLACTALKPERNSARAADRVAGVALDAKLADAASGLRLHWRALLRDGGNYVREQFTFEGAQELDLKSIALIDVDLPDASVAGTVDGSPVVADDRFLGVEYPMASARVEYGRATVSVPRVLPLRARVATQYSAALGVAIPGQMRRCFAAYLERERAHPYRTFLHYNSWYDIGYFTPYTQDDALRVIDAYGQKLVRQRGVTVDSLLFDDGWDDYKNLWQFNSGFPHGFAPLAQAAQKFGAQPGMWLSPWGGYGDPRRQRLATAKVAGYEVDEQGLALSGPKYYKLFHDTALNLLKQYHINQFKLDGTGSADKVTPGSAFDSDFTAAIALIDDLRAVKPDLFINLTTGTWPSPFWLRTADSIWRGGEDHSFAGRGSDRQRWITYRDADTYGGIVRQGPLFPLNALMLHGIIFARHAHGLDRASDADFASEVQSYFASGTALQEMYISPDLLSEKNWDTLAAAARWARTRAAVLRDSHWIGGDPARGDVYGWAAWSPARAVIALRNPTENAQEFSLDLRRTLELPAGGPSVFRAKPVYAGSEAREFNAETSAQIRLAPFAVEVWDLEPVRDTPPSEHSAR